MQFDKKVFWRVFALSMIIEACLFLAGCTSAWLTAVSGMLPAIAAVCSAAVAFVSALQGKTVSAAFTAAVKKWQSNIASEISNAQALIASIKQGATTTLISQFQSVMQGVLSEFNSILAGMDITDSATVAKFTQFVGLGIAAINAVLALIPLALTKLQAKAPKDELKHYDALAGKTTQSAVNLMKETYAAILAEPTANPDVNAALDQLPRSI